MDNILEQIRKNPYAIIQEASRRDFLTFARYMQPSLDVQPFHEVYYHVLDLFAHKKVKKLIVTIPPQHGKSEGSSRKLPAFLLGLNPELKVFIGSYATDLARGFNQDVQRIMESAEYHSVFPESMIAHSVGAQGKGTAKRSSDYTEIIGHRGSLTAVGRGGALTGKTVDISILDDVYKDYEEANSHVIRESAWKWYTAVVRSRLHNDSQELIVFTRWHQDDIVGRLEQKERIIDICSHADLENIPEDAWLRINFEAIKTTEKTEYDQRELGEPLWSAKHSLKKLLAYRKLDKQQFQCLYQGNPASAEGRLYEPFKTYSNIADYGALVTKGNYTDCADEGTDYLCSICYDKVISNFAKDEHGNFMYFILVTDVVFSDEPIEVTTQSVPMMLNRNGTQYANIESNNGGRSFAKIIEPKTTTSIRWFAQKVNKESRIITNAGLVTQHIVMPADWKNRWPHFENAVTGFLRNFKANEHDDAPDVLTGIIEKEILTNHKGIMRKN